MDDKIVLYKDLIFICIDMTFSKCFFFYLNVVSKQYLARVLTSRECNLYD